MIRFEACRTLPWLIGSLHLSFIIHTRNLMGRLLQWCLANRVFGATMLKCPAGHPSGISLVCATPGDSFYLVHVPSRRNGTASSNDIMVFSSSDMMNTVGDHCGRMRHISPSRADENPHDVASTPLHEAKVTMLCDIASTFVVDP
ncbi:hypothetical protein NPIL_362571 [Nephila pilipes]|uniref:Uncharacterized protein n=1 Tax=Nephila pilipes TaxID=299642 RepID=A0A8X6P3I8_NEPPI|nr:hypothetical protein NPIL_362571 [Nephila pilipes]